MLDFSSDDLSNFYDCPDKKCTSFRITLDNNSRGTQNDCSKAYQDNYADPSLVSIIHMHSSVL